MNLKNQPPVFVPAEHRTEIEKLSKAALMDMVWDFAKQIASGEHEVEACDDYVMSELRRRREIITAYRQQERGKYDCRKGIYR